MARTKEDRRKREVPNFMLSRSTGKSFKWLPPADQKVVWTVFTTWLDAASVRGAVIEPPSTKGLSEQAGDTLLCMCRDAQEGIDSYWCKYSHPHPIDERATIDRRMNDERTKKEPTEIKNYVTEGVSPTHADGFVPPTVEDVRKYAVENGLQDDSTVFVNYYQARDWKYKGYQLMDWKALYRTWLARGEQQKTSSLKKVSAQDYRQRDWTEAEMEERLGVRDLFKDGDSDGP